MSMKNPPNPTNSKFDIAANGTSQMIPQSSGDAVIVTDAQGCVTFMNPVAEELTGHSAAAGLYRPLRAVLSIVSESSGDALVDPSAWLPNAANGAAPVN